MRFKYEMERKNGLNYFISVGYKYVNLFSALAVCPTIEVSSGANSKKTCTVFTINRYLHAVCSTDLLSATHHVLRNFISKIWNSLVAY